MMILYVPAWIFFGLNLLAMENEGGIPSMGARDVASLVQKIPKSEIENLISQLEEFEKYPEKLKELDPNRRKMTEKSLPWLPWLKSNWSVQNYTALVRIFSLAIYYDQKERTKPPQD